MKARIPKHREFIINFPDSIPRQRPTRAGQSCSRSWRTTRKPTTALLSTLLPLLRTARLTSKLQEEYGFEYTVEYVQ